MSIKFIPSSVKRAVRRTRATLDRGLYLSGLRTTDHLTLPDFIGIGPTQSGSTWLFTHLAHHPDIYLHPHKELNYIDKHYNNWPLSYYASLFKEGTGRIKGEVTPAYSTLCRDRIAYTHRIMPDVRLILSIRNPIERSWSAARKAMHLLGWTPDIMDQDEFYIYLNQEQSYVPDPSIVLPAAYSPGNTAPYEPGLLEGFYSRIIDNWLTFYPAEQLLVVFFDELRDAPASFLSKVCRHIGVRENIDWGIDLKQPVNTNPQQTIPDKVHHFLKDKYRQEIEELHKRFQIPIQDWLN